MSASKNHPKTSRKIQKRSGYIISTITFLYLLMALRQPRIGTRAWAGAATSKRQKH
ncbi:MAG: hypothetical protein ABIG84_06145 [archaeon]